MRYRDEELVNKLNAFADWLENANNLHCDSVPRRAATTISRLEEENYQMYLQLNKRDLTVRDIVDRFIGRFRLMIYLMKKKYSSK